MAAASPHPFDPLRPDEISRASRIVRPHFGGQDPNFRVITLLEPAKKQMIPYLEKEHHKQPLGQIPTRYARVEASIKGDAGENQLFELIVDLNDNKVAQKQHVKGKHSYIDANYMKEVEAACLANDEVQAEIRTLDLPNGAAVVVEPWAYATDGDVDAEDYEVEYDFSGYQGAA
ncbi:hypothetical protein ACHAPJ_010431 [Fusarium lateritium]